MRIRGRIIRPSNLAERRLLLTFGVPFIRVPRGTNPFIVARRARRLAQLRCADGEYLRQVIEQMSAPQQSPGPDTCEIPAPEPGDAVG